MKNITYTHKANDPEKLTDKQRWRSEN